jgi:hypothetical protein
MTLFSNIRRAYENICVCIETDNRADEARLQEIRGRLNAVTEGFSAESRRQDKVGLGEDE